jgi:peptidoglycan/LPS O-acetylase OafA/YrhL
MLGTLRFVLALLVVMNHLWLPTANKVGAHAVLGFYVISGFLMTRIVSEVYIGPRGRLRYFTNRFLRIFPAYWFVSGLTLAGLALFPERFEHIHSAIRRPDAAYEWFQNLTLIDMIYAPLRVVPPAWSLSVELVFYLLIGTGLSRSRLGTTLWWGSSLAYTVFLVASDASFGDRYTPPAAASLFFSTGAVVYHLTKQKVMPRRMMWWSGALLLFAVWPLLVGIFDGDTNMLGFYGAFALFVPLFAWTVGISSQQATSGSDKLLGDLAYPVFLGHYFSAGVTNLLFWNRLAPQGIAHFLVSLFICVALAMAMARYLDPAVNRLRNRIRPSPAIH